MTERKQGLLAALGGYLLWGILPLYWKLLEGVGAYEILAHRIVWSFACMVLVLAVLKRGPEFRDTVSDLLVHRKRGFLMISAALLITANWCIFIWAVTHDHIVDSSFGYYINPLVSVFLGVLLFHERLSKLKWFSIAIAFFGILVMSFLIGHFPVVSLDQAITFALYGAAKKELHMSPFISITLETLLVLPLALGYLFFLEGDGTSHFMAGNMQFTLCLAGAGIVTALPLLLFSAGANHLPLNVLGFCQYISPSLSLLIGLFLYHEPFTEIQLFGFSTIWISLVLFTISDFRENREQ